MLVSLGKAAACCVEVEDREEGPSRKQACLDPEAAIPSNIRCACLLDELFKARAVAERASKRVEDLYAELDGLVVDNKGESEVGFF